MYQLYLVCFRKAVEWNRNGLTGTVWNRIRPNLNRDRTGTEPEPNGTGTEWNRNRTGTETTRNRHE